MAECQVVEPRSANADVKYRNPEKILNVCVSLIPHLNPDRPCLLCSQKFWDFFYIANKKMHLEWIALQNCYRDYLDDSRRNRLCWLPYCVDDIRPFLQVVSCYRNALQPISQIPGNPEDFTAEFALVRDFLSVFEQIQAIQQEIPNFSLYRFVYVLWFKEGLRALEVMSQHKLDWVNLENHPGDRKLIWEKFAEASLNFDRMHFSEGSATGEDPGNISRVKLQMGKIPTKVRTGAILNAGSQNCSVQTQTGVSGSEKRSMSVATQTDSKIFVCREMQTEELNSSSTSGGLICTQIR